MNISERITEIIKEKKEKKLKRQRILSAYDKGNFIYSDGGLIVYDYDPDKEDPEIEILSVEGPASELSETEQLEIIKQVWRFTIKVVRQMEEDNRRQEAISGEINLLGTDFLLRGIPKDVIAKTDEQIRALKMLQGK